MRQLIEQAELQDRIKLDSAGTGSWHVGEPPDARARAAAKQRGFTIGGRAQQFTRAHFARYEYVLAMDESNRRTLTKMAGSNDTKSKIYLFRDFDPSSARGLEVPDPYYGGTGGFDEVIDICIDACEGFLEHLRETKSL